MATEPERVSPLSSEQENELDLDRMSLLITCPVCHREAEWDGTLEENMFEGECPLCEASYRTAIRIEDA